MISIKEKEPEYDNTYLVLSPTYESKPFQAYLDNNGDWWDCRVPKHGIGFIPDEITHYEPIDLIEDIDEL